MLLFFLEQGRRRPAFCALGTIAVVLLLVLTSLLLKINPDFSYSVRRDIDLVVAEPEPAPQAVEAPSEYIHKNDYMNRQFVREYARLEALGTSDGYWNDIEYPPMPRQRGLVNFYWGRVTITTADGYMPVPQLRRVKLAYDPTEEMAFLQDMFNHRLEEDDFFLPLQAENLGDDGAPLRWSASVDTVPGLLACSRRAQADDDMVPGGGLLPQSLLTQAAQVGRYRAFALRYAQKYNLPASLVLAIMHTESDFNPLAVSRSQAIGLMQVVPHTAGTEVYRYLTGLPGKPAVESLFMPETNIRYGSTYLYLLSYRYFGYIYNLQSRQLCMIAAYNAGPGAVLRMFSPDRNRAIERINSMNPSQVYAALTSRMPSGETRRYVELVTDRMRLYSGK